MIELMIANKELLKILYAVLVVVICMFIVSRTHKLFKISSHQGIRYFRNAFLFYGVAFAVRYFIGAIHFSGTIKEVSSLLIKIFFEYFLIMGGFFLLYSLLWKKFEDSKSSLFNKRILIFYFMALVLVLLDLIWGTLSFMFFSQILLFFTASIISFRNYKLKGDKRIFSKFYFFIMLLNFIVWVLNTLLALVFSWDHTILVIVYAINTIIFLLFLYGVNKVTK